jgi:hypothetical protein
MSRTYRRRSGDQRWKGFYERKPWQWRGDSGGPGSYSGAPSWWTREFMTKPQRAKVRKLLHVVLHLHNLEDAPLFPLAKKPHDYYW